MVHLTPDLLHFALGSSPILHSVAIYLLQLSVYISHKCLKSQALE